MNIAIVPARGGSKRIPLKNIKIFYGIPMIIRTIRAIKEAECFDRIIISTESEQVADCALNESNVEISWRDKELASDSANTVDVIAREVECNDISPDSAVCCLYAPNPFLHSGAINLGLKSLKTAPSPKYVSAVTTYPFPIQRSLKFSQSNDFLEMASPEYLLTHSQNLKPRFHETAQFWWAYGDTWMNKHPMQMSVRGVYIPRWMTQDIDNPEDWRQAEIRWRILQETKQFQEYIFSEKNIVNSLNFAE